MNKKRPVNLDLFTIKFPITAIGSILHRISGFLLFFFIPFFLWFLQASLSSAKDFAAVSDCLGNPIVKFFVWAFVAALAYHLLAGIKHLLMDLGIGETFKGGRRATITVFVIAIIVIVLAGVWLW